jgi:hypothetical protein
MGGENIRRLLFLESTFLSSFLRRSRNIPSEKKNY